MDGLSEEVKFSFAGITTDGISLSEPWEAYLKIVGRFSVTVGDRILYTEDGFCVVEFAVKSQLWLKRVNETREDFIYTSQESEEPGLVWFKRSDGEWRIGSVYQEYEELATFGIECLSVALSAYFDLLRAFVAEAFGINVAGILAWAEANNVR